MGKLLSVFVLALGFSVSSFAFATVKECDGGKNSSSVLGLNIVIEITNETLKVISAPGYEEGEGSYPSDGIDAETQNLRYAGADEDQQDGYIFSIDPELLKEKTSSPITVTLDSGVEGQITANYRCHDPR